MNNDHSWILKRQTTYQCTNCKYWKINLVDGNCLYYGETFLYTIGSYSIDTCKNLVMKDILI